MASLKLEHLSCEFQSSRGSFRAVDDLSFDVFDGELVVLVGPSGSGKSTTLRLIAGLEDASSGTITAEGRVMNLLPPRDRDIAMVFQGFALYPHMTVERNLAFGLKMRGVPESERNRILAEVADRLGLSSLLHRKPHQLSGGERQRVALGRAMVRKPKLFLLDEPLASLDPPLRAAARTEIKRLQKDLRTTMVYVTHDQEEAMSLADRIAVLRHGRLQQFATPRDLFSRPANRFVAGFFGSPPMNFLRGRIHNVSGQSCFLADGLQVPLDPARLPSAFTNEEMFLGIRPHEIRRAQVSGGLPATIHSVDLLGDAVLVRALMGNAWELVAKLPATDSARTGENLRLEFHPEGLHFFAADETGRRLN